MKYKEEYENAKFYADFYKKTTEYWEREAYNWKEDAYFWKYGYIITWCLILIWSIIVCLVYK